MVKELERDGEPRWPSPDPENGDFTDGWNQAISECRNAFEMWRAGTANSAPKDETAWLLENGEVTPKYIGVIDGALRWTDDSLKALRLARREDADALADLVEECWHVREHMWCTSGGRG